MYRLRRAENFKLTDTMKIAVRYFVKTVLPMWREMPVERWFLKTLKDLTQLYDMWVEIQNDRNGLQNSICPVEVLRHLHVMRHMADSLLNWDYKVLPYFSPLFDPHPKPENNKDLYGYGALEREEKVAARSLLYTMITSIVPAPQDVQPVVYHVEHVRPPEGVFNPHPLVIPILVPAGNGVLHDSDESDGSPDEYVESDEFHEDELEDMVDDAHLAEYIENLIIEHLLEEAETESQDLLLQPEGENPNVAPSPPDGNPDPAAYEYDLASLFKEI
ncbi:hypothetical protein ACJJTC_012883 [Scirpophaga incertulas]